MNPAPFNEGASIISEETQTLLATTMELMAALFIIVVGLVALRAVIAFFVDVTQTKHAVRRNYPVLGCFRYSFANMGEFLR